MTVDLETSLVTNSRHSFNAMPKEGDPEDDQIESAARLAGIFVIPEKARCHPMLGQTYAFLLWTARKVGSEVELGSHM